MYVKCSLHSVAWLAILVTPQPVFTQGQETVEGRKALVKELIRKLDSTDLHTANQAAYDLGQMRARESVPALLKVLQSSRLLSVSQHIFATDENQVSEWVLTDVKATIINSLGKIGDRRATRTLEQYLNRSFKNSKGAYGPSAAHALYLINARSYEYTDFDGGRKLYAPSPVTGEEAMMRFRPDLKPTKGLTSSLEIKSTGQGA